MFVGTRERGSVLSFVPALRPEYSCRLHGTNSTIILLGGYTLIYTIGGSVGQLGAAGGWVLGGGHSALSPTSGVGW